MINDHTGVIFSIVTVTHMYVQVYITAGYHLNIDWVLSFAIDYHAICFEMLCLASVFLNHESFLN